MTGAFANLSSAQQIALTTLRMRALDYHSDRPILGDAISAELIEKLKHDLAPERIPTSVVLVHAVRAKSLDAVVRQFVARHPTAVVVDLGSGLDPRAHRCAPPPGVDWYDVDFPEVARLRQRFLPRHSHAIGADLTGPAGWLTAIPADRPTMVVADGLMALLPGEAFKTLTRNLTSHFSTGELAFNAYTPFAMRAGNKLPVLRTVNVPTAGFGFVDPREPQRWGARLTLIEEILLARAPEVALYPRPIRTLARLTALSTRISRAGDRIVRYRF